MYPDWPRSSADLVPLPRCDGPKLKPFDFQGTQTIEFLEHVGEGLHAHVFKVQILGQIYALKLFRFVYDYDWLGPASDTDPDDRALMSAFYNYAEPFSCECRAFGRLHEAGHEELAVGCFGYILLDEDHERALHDRFGDINFNGNIEYPGGDDMRSRFLGRDGRPPPIRGVVKEFMHQAEEDGLQPAVFHKMLGDIRRLQQLGIMRIDVAARQLVGGKISDFSTAITVPHFVTTPELNPSLTRDMRTAMELETFRLSKDDYLAFDEMMFDWNLDHADKKGTIAVRAFPGGQGSPPLRCYKLRNEAARERVFTYVDPRQYDWKRRTKGINKCRRRRLRTKPPIWV
ncbi:Kinetochore complex Sim4 subunit Fta2 [Pleurostoma richardsiae]|uniref:Kinetochore complex Sim4 subunit Fta2 n=1 Tax=Pleurostoma richardsiae TaxID=41990 RepID=A0AA38VFP2_9PEZI|nr:Kinetochore complex Sim4 subunit Fta2 [Pleurostoma richardsiae]